MSSGSTNTGFESLKNISFIDVLLGRRSKRFPMGGEIQSGPFAYKSKYPPKPLSELEKMTVLTAVAGNTGWHNMIPFNKKYAPYLPNYSAGAGGRTFPSPAGFEIVNMFFTDGTGVYYFDTKDAQCMTDRNSEGELDLETMVEKHKNCVRKLSDKRLEIPLREPHVESHNHWITNHPGSLLVIPVVDLSENLIASLCYFLQNGYGIYDDINRKNIGEIEHFGNLRYEQDFIPISFLESFTLQEAVAEIVGSCYAGALMMNAMGLGGWMYSGINPYSILGASGDPEAPGLGFRYDVSEDWTFPNPTGIEGVLEGHCPPYYPDMRAAVESFVERKFGKGGPFNPETPGPWKDSSKVRSSAQVHSEEFKECVALEAEYILKQFGKFPGTTPTMLSFMYLQAQHIDLDFYDMYYNAGVYMKTHSEHMKNWHPDEEF